MLWYRRHSVSEWFSEIWRSREILYFLAWRDVKVRYKQAVLGVAWAVLQPLFSYAALLLWTYFAVTLAQVGNSLINNSGLITKIYFPRVLLPAAAAFGGLLDL